MQMMKREVKASCSKQSTFDRSAGQQQTSDHHHRKDAANQAKLPKSVLIAKPGSSSTHKNRSRAGAPTPINPTKHGGISTTS